MPKITEPNKREALAWAAGFFDGEGCTTFHQGAAYQYFYPRLRIGQSGENGKEVLEKFQAAIGLGKIYGPYPPAKSQRKVTWKFELYGKERVTAALELMWEWLGTEKRNQAQHVFNGELKFPT